MKVDDVMKHKVITCYEDEPMSIVEQRMRKKEISGLPVLDRNEKLIGMYSSSDVIKQLVLPEHLVEIYLPSPLEVIEVPIRELINWSKFKSTIEDVGNRPVKEAMSKKVYTISRYADIEDASGIMDAKDVNRLPVLEDEKLVGIITRGDIVRGLGLSKSYTVKMEILGYVENSGDRSVLSISDEYSEGLSGLNKGDRIVVLYFMDRDRSSALKIHPRGDVSKEKRGVFSTRSPKRPNPIGLTVVEIVEIEGTRIVVEGLDACNESPILDLKPYVEEFGC